MNIIGELVMSSVVGVLFSGCLKAQKSVEGDAVDFTASQLSTSPFSESEGSEVGSFFTRRRERGGVEKSSYEYMLAPI